MKICILTPRFPFPQYGGDTLRINEIARYLKSQGHTLILVSMCDEPVPDVNHAKTLYDEVYYVARNHSKSILNCMLGLLGSAPLQCSYYRSNEYMSQLSRVVEKHKPDLYISHLLRMVPYLERLGVESKSIVEMTDALSKTYGLSMNAKGVGLLKYIYMFEKKRISRYEQYVIERFPKVVLVSQDDVELLQTTAGKECKSLAMFTNGVHLPRQKEIVVNKDKITFMGNMRSMQNQDAAKYFVKDIFPLIKERIPNAKFHIVGSLPPSNIKSLESNDVIVTGFINDLYGYISDSCINIAPVRVAAGIQNKVLVAMGCGIPVVMSSLISQGIPLVKDSENCFICDSAEEFANRCIQLMTNPKERNCIGHNGYTMVKNNFCWDECLKGYEMI